MFVGCFQISISIIIKHVQSIVIIKAFLSAWIDLLKILVPGGGGHKKLLGCGLLGVDQYPGWNCDLWQNCKQSWVILSRSVLVFVKKESWKVMNVIQIGLVWKNSCECQQTNTRSKSTKEKAENGVKLV